MPMLERTADVPCRVRTLFLSDVHLGAKGCQAAKLLSFLQHYEADTIYLVGDFVDAWQLKTGWYWPQAHNDVVQKLLRKARKGTRILYIPGNHDEHFNGEFEIMNWTRIDAHADQVAKPALAGQVRARPTDIPVAGQPAET
jgi:UDP-2,3-diacylglucosamine pyrophosphatase LpxH